MDSIKYQGHGDIKISQIRSCNDTYFLNLMLHLTSPIKEKNPIRVDVELPITKEQYNELYKRLISEENANIWIKEGKLELVVQNTPPFYNCSEQVIFLKDE